MATEKLDPYLIKAGRLLALMSETLHAFMRMSSIKPCLFGPSNIINLSSVMKSGVSVARASIKDQAFAPKVENAKLRTVSSVRLYFWVVLVGGPVIHQPLKKIGQRAWPMYQ